MGEHSAPSEQPRILLITRSASVPELQKELLARSSEAVFCPTKQRQPVLKGYRSFTRTEFSRLREKLKNGEFDLVIAYAPAEQLWPRHGFFLNRFFKYAKKRLLEFGTLGPNLTPQLLEGTNVPLVIYEWDDTTVVQRKHWPLLDRSVAYFKVNCPTNLFKAFQFQDRRNDDVFNIVRQPKFRERANKLRPISLGGPDLPYLESCLAEEKKADVFFAGSLDYTPARRMGLRVLEKLKEEGFRIDHPSERLSRKEFLKRCSQAWLVWAPEGAEWDTHRAYEAALVRSVPLLNYPTTMRYQPFIDGEHAFYYGIEGDHLADVIRHALEDKKRLKTISKAAQEHVRRYHLHRVLAEMIIRGGLGLEETWEKPPALILNE